MTKGRERERPKASFILRVYNEAKDLERCLKTVFSQRSKYPFEVIIVYTKSTDDTLAIAKRFPVRIVNIKSSEFSFGRALNLGCEAAKGEYLVFLSGHAIPIGEKWLDTLLDNFEDPKVAGVYGREVPRKDSDLLIRYWLTLLAFLT